MKPPKAEQETKKKIKEPSEGLLHLGDYPESFTCCAVSILSFSIPSMANPFRRTSSVDSGTAAVSVTVSDWDVRLHKSSIGSCSQKTHKL